MKCCRKCGEEKPLEDFPERSTKQARDGRYSYCRPCSRILTRERQRRWRERNPEKAKAESKKASTRFRKANPNYRREWYYANVETERKRERERMRIARAEDPERVRAAYRRWRAENPERARAFDTANTHQRRALKKQSGRSILGGYSFAYMTDYIAELLMQPCEYCDGPGGTLDHVVPLTRGGPHIPANLVSACRSCNCSKGNRLLSEWAR